MGYGGRGGDLEHGVRVVLSLLVPFRVKQGAEKDAAALRSPKGLPPAPDTCGAGRAPCSRGCVLGRI